MNYNFLRIILIISILISGSYFGTNASDFDTIYKRMYNEYLSSNPSQNLVNKLLSQMNEDGSFQSVNYKAADGSPRKHVENLTILASAFKNPQNAYFNDGRIKNAYIQSLNFWVNTNHNANNWWYRYIAYPRELSISFILMSKEVAQNKILFDKTIKYLYWAYEHSDTERLSGANGTDIILGAIASSVLTENDTQMIDFRNKMNSLLTIQKVNGVQADYLFAQHCGHGRQLYFASYGKEFVNSALYYLEFCNGTKYQSCGVKLLQDLFANGAQWIFYGKHYDPCNSGRFNNSARFYEQIQTLAGRLVKLDSLAFYNMEKVYRRIAGENSLEGNRMFWRFDYMVHRRKNYMTSVRMTSTRTVGNESGNGDGEFNYYSSNGTNYIFITGKEYSQDYFKKFNNRQFPGITAEQDDIPLPAPEWGEEGNNNHIYAGGVSDSIYGTCAMILNRRGVKAHKAWFFFDQEFVCLGSGIYEEVGKAPVYTTINQCNTSGRVLFSQEGKVTTMKDKVTLTNLGWVLHGGIAYFSLDPKAMYHIANDTALFSINIDHGINPQNKTYAYIVKPDMSSPKDALKYSNELPVEIIANTESVQAVRHKKDRLIEVIFYSAGTLDIGNGNTLSVDVPCALLWHETGNSITLSNPRCESDNPLIIHVIITRNGKPAILSFDMAQLEMAGSSINQTVQ